MDIKKMLGIKQQSERPINSILQSISRRAERLSPEQQANTFVSIGGVEATLLNTDHRVIFGRRGTGKTHILSFILDSIQNKGDIGIYLDLRTIGSNSYIYSDSSLPVSERATRLLRDFIGAVYDDFFEKVTDPSSKFDLTSAQEAVELLSQSAREVIVKKTVEHRDRSEGRLEKPLASGALT